MLREFPERVNDHLYLHMKFCKLPPETDEYAAGLRDQVAALGS